MRRQTDRRSYVLRGELSGRSRKTCYTTKIVLQLMRNRIWPFGFMFRDWENDNALGSPFVAWHAGSVPRLFCI